MVKDNKFEKKDDSPVKESFIIRLPPLPFLILLLTVATLVMADP